VDIKKSRSVVEWRNWRGSGRRRS